MLRSPFLKTVSFVLGFTIVTGSASAQVATEWSYGKAFDLGKLAGAISSEARAINNLGEVVGYSAFNTNSYTATAWIGGVQTTLPSLAGTAGQHCVWRERLRIGGRQQRPRLPDL